jgi:hypothetical protein
MWKLETGKLTPPSLISSKCTFFCLIHKLKLSTLLEKPLIRIVVFRVAVNLLSILSETNKWVENNQSELNNVSG